MDSIEPEATGPAASTTATSTSAPGSAAIATSPPTIEPLAGGDGRGDGEATSYAEAAASLRHIRASCLMNMHYHKAREGSLDLRHRLIMFAVIVLGAGSVLDLMPIAARAYAGAAVVIFATLDLVFDYPNRVRDHAISHRNYCELLSEAAADNPSLARVARRLDQLNADEEPAYQVIIEQSCNQAQLEVYGHEAHLTHVPFLVGQLGKWLRMSWYRFKDAPAKS